MDHPNLLLSRIEAAHLWACFHKDWLLQIRSQLRSQLPPEYFVFVESEHDPLPVIAWRVEQD